EHPFQTVVVVAWLPVLVGALSLLFRRRPPEPEREALPEVAAEPVREAIPEPVPAPAREVLPEPAPEEPVELLAPGPLPVVEQEVAPEPEPVAAEAPPAALEEPAAPPRARLRDRLRLTSEAFAGRLGALLSGRSVDAELLDELEMLLMSADLGVRTADSLLETVKKKAAGADAETVRSVLHDVILEKLRRVEPENTLAIRGKPHVILVLGVNGSGKTTTIGKLAARYAAAGHEVILGAGDTFRAAAIEQLQVWGERVGCEVIAGTPGGDPSAVAFDTVKAATARGADVAIIDTAGRLQTKKPLMEELGKLVRVIGRSLEGAPHETLLVLDANTGQNAISQARLFTEVAGVTALVLTKLDGTAKGGVIVGLADEFGIPVRHVGVGEAVEDLRDFAAEEFVDALFGGGEA
ncbi:MAG: signal recognition particle-docking protein FtsY, partial [Deltaproteobacteria bacterium]|nr:signal recognition particle-docking protein FtsY [Deltaproteobacteria bacterium]